MTKLLAPPMPSPYVQAAVLYWSPQLAVHAAEGACETVLGSTHQALVGQSLAAALCIGEAEAQALDARARSGASPVEFLQTQGNEATRRTLRLQLGADAKGGVAGVMNLQTLLAGAPPIQISALSSSLSHELRNPLSSVKMAVQTLARNTTLGERDQRRLTLANREIRTMERMLWLFSEYGQDAKPRLTALPLRDVVQEARDMVALELAERRIEVEIEEESHLPRLQLDAARLRPVLAQLLLNVAMGQPEDSHVKVALKRGPEHQVLMVILDPSAALPSEERGSLFEPFGTRVARGAGLSLAALRRALQNQGGDVSAEGGDEPGLVFTLRFAA